MSTGVRIGQPADREFVIQTARRFAAFALPAWRTAHEIVGGEVRSLDDFFDGGLQSATLLVAESDGRPSGFAFLEHVTDYFSGDRHGHLGMIAVAESAEGQGVGTALLSAAEDWARTNRYARITLNVFEGNERARRVYENAGYRVETLRYVKLLG